jgi:hypothetical protein
MATVYELGRVARLPGVKPQMILDPTSIPKRTLKNVKYMLTHGVMTGGWSSKSKALAKAIALHFGFRLADTGTAKSVYCPEDQEVRRIVTEMHTADCVAYLLDNPQRAASFKRHREMQRAAFDRGDTDVLAFTNKTLHANALRVVADYYEKKNVRSPQHTAAIQFINDRLPIVLDLERVI